MFSTDHGPKIKYHGFKALACTVAPSESPTPTNFSRLVSNQEGGAQANSAHRTRHRASNFPTMKALGCDAFTPVKAMPAYSLKLAVSIAGGKTCLVKPD